MKEDKLGKLSMELSVEVLNLVKDLHNTGCLTVGGNFH